MPTMYILPWKCAAVWAVYDTFSTHLLRGDWYMPTYEYLCQTCSHRFETWQKMVDEPLTTCPECGNHIRRVLYPAGVVFKGSGFYKTDYSNNNNKPLPSANGESKKAESSTESKPASESTSSTSETSASSKAPSSSSSNNTSSSTASASNK
jgi:putative FmdB family regulatory protein